MMSLLSNGFALSGDYAEALFEGIGAIVIMLVAPLIVIAAALS